jgi:hypothetical protein
MSNPTPAIGGARLPVPETGDKSAETDVGVVTATLYADCNIFK